MAFNEKYAFTGVNKNTGVKYYTFEKSERLDKIIELYNQVKYSIS